MIAMLRKRPQGNFAAGVIAALALALCAPLALAQGAAKNAIEAINFSSQQGGKVIVKVTLREPLAGAPQGFAVTNPPRIALDFPDTDNAIGRTQIEAGEGDLKSISVVQTANRTRLVMNLTRNLTYTTASEGRLVVVTIDSGNAPAIAVGTAQSTTPSTRFAEAAPGTTARQSLRDVDFRRGNSGEGRVVVDLSSANTGIDIRQQGRQVLVDFINTSAPKNLVRRLDVGDFGTPIKFVDVFEQGGNARMVIEPRGLWEYSAYQTDTQFILEVKPVKEDPNKLIQGSNPGYSGEKLSLNFQNVEVRAVLQVIADFTGLNIITSDTVGGNLTLRLKDVPWDQALDIILQAKGLGLRKSGNVIWIAPRDELAIKEQAELAAAQKKTELEPLRTQNFQLNYAKASEVMVQISANQALANNAGGGGTNSGRMLSPRGAINFDIRTNQVFVTDIPSKLEEIAAVIAKIDIPVRQVLIEARIVEANDSFGRSLGVKLGGSVQNLAGGQYPNNHNVVVGGTTGPGRGSPTGGVLDSSPFVNLPALGQGGFDPATFAVSLFNAGATRYLNLEISALEADGKGKVVSSPRIVTADQKNAFISQGTKIPFQKSTSSGATAVEFVEATLKLDVTPQITPEGNVILVVKINKDSLGTLTALGREINVKEVRTEVLVENGGTVVIGGIFEQSDSSSETKVPFLGDLPYLGYLFKTKSVDTSRTELLVFLTPRVVTERSVVR